MILKDLPEGVGKAIDLLSTLTGKFFDRELRAQ